jgi:DNA-binding NtrC family response regulator
VRHFLARFAAEEGKRIGRISGEALALLAAYRWPGNVRQLENAVFRAIVLAESDVIDVDEFPQIASQVARSATPAPDTPPPAVEPMEIDVEAPPLAGQHESHIGNPIPQPTRPAGPALALVDANGEVRPLDEVEAEVIRFAIAHYRGQMSEVARRLQIGRSTLYRKLDALGLATEVPNPDMVPL